MEPLVSMKDFEHVYIRPGSSYLDIFYQTARVVLQKLKEKREEENSTAMEASTIEEHDQAHLVGSRESSPNSVEESVREIGGWNQKKKRKVDGHDNGSQSKKQNSKFILNKDMASTSGTKEPIPSLLLEKEEVYSVGITTRETSNVKPSSHLGFQEKNRVDVRKRGSSSSTKKESIDGGDDKDWCLTLKSKSKPKPKKMNNKKANGSRFSRGEVSEARYSTDANDLPEELKRKIETLEGIESFEKAKMKMVIEKGLTPTDLTRSACRLSMPVKQIEPESFLSELEIKRLADQEDWPVFVISPGLDVFALTFRQWNMPKDTGKVSSSYVLKTGWKELHQKDHLNVEDVVQVWSFRDVMERLYFAIVLVEKAKCKKGCSPSGGGDECSQPSSRSTTPPNNNKSNAVDGDYGSSSGSEIGKGTETKVFEEGMIRGRSSTPCSKNNDVVSDESGQHSNGHDSQV